MTSNLILGDCLKKMRDLPNNSIDAVVTDPPYGLSFMGKKWDYDVPSVEIWAECLRVVKPGGYLLAFGGTRTIHRIVTAIEDAGFEIRDMIAWVYGSGFPKSLNIGKAVDKLQGNRRENIGENPNHRKLQQTGTMVGEPHTGDGKITKGTSAWEGWGTALKPALEPITVARKPLSEKTVAQNVLKWGTGGINIDGSRVEGLSEKEKNWTPQRQKATDQKIYGGGKGFYPKEEQEMFNKQGRFPANFIHDGSDEVERLFPKTKSGGGNKANKLPTNTTQVVPTIDNSYWNGNEGSAARFFYCAKASKSERGESNRHPTVKPIKLMEYLVKLVSREGATVLDPFMGSGSTGMACRNSGREFIGIELDEEYFEIAKKRIEQTK